MPTNLRNHRKIYIFLLEIPFVDMEGTGSAKTPEGEVEKSDGKKEDVSTKAENTLIYLTLLFHILSLVLTLEVLWKLTSYVLNNFNEIIGLSLLEIIDKTNNYIVNFNPYKIILHTILFIALVLAMYLMLGILSYFLGKLKRIPKIIIALLAFDILLCCFLKLKINIEDIGEYYRSISTLILLLILLSYWICESSEKIRDPKELWKYTKRYMRKYYKSMGILFYSLFFYFIVCFFYTEMKEIETGNYAGVFILPGIAFLISGGFFICAIIIQRLAQKNAQILKSLEVEVGKNWKYVIEELQGHISSLLAHFLVAVSSYVFSKAILSTILLENSSNLFLLILAKVNEGLPIILLIPLYLFFYRVASATLKSIYQKIYEICEKPAGLIPYQSRRDYVVNMFVKLTKAIIVILIVASVLSRFVVFKPLVDFFLEPPLNYLIGTGAAITIVLWLLVLILDPFFEGETIEMGSHRGKIEEVGVFFTRMETMTREQVYIPNAELLARTVRRISARKPGVKGEEYEKNQNGTEKKESQGKIKEEKGIVIHFSCTLSYRYRSDKIEEIFKGLFRETGEDKSKKEKKNDFRDYLSKRGFDIDEEESKYIFSEESRPFVFIEEFKDYGVVYRANFRVRDSLYAPIFRGYFMKKFKEKMEEENMPIVTPVKFEIKDIHDKDFRW